MEHQFWQLEHWGAHCALQDEYGQRVTYHELAQRADAFAQQLTPKTRALVLILCHNCIDCVAAYLGCLCRRLLRLPAARPCATALGR